MRSVTIREVAARAGVSIATASRVLSGHRSTSEASRDSVTTAAKELGFRANAQARSLRTTRTSTIGVLVSDVRNPFFAEIAHVVEQRALAGNMATLLCNANESTQQQDQCLELLVSQRVDGVIMTPQGDGSGILREVLQLPLPIVFVDRTIDGVTVPSITSDNSTGTKQAIAHLAALGHHRIGMIAGPSETSTGRERLFAYKQAISKLGLSQDTQLIYHGDFQHESGRRGAEFLLDINDSPTAIFAADSLMTFGLLEACSERDITPGSDLSVIGYDDVTMFSHIRPRLSVVSHDAGAMARLAVSALEQMINGEQASSMVLDAELIVRGSTGPRLTQRTPA